MLTFGSFLSISLISNVLSGLLVTGVVHMIKHLWHNHTTTTTTHLLLAAA